MTQPFSEEQIAAIEAIVARILEARTVDDEAKALFLIDTHTRGLVEEMSGRVDEVAQAQQAGHAELVDRLQHLTDGNAETKTALQHLTDATSNGFNLVNERIDNVESRFDDVQEGIEALSNQNVQILRRLDER